MIYRRGCAFRADGEGGGSSCSEISNEDKLYIAIMASLCALTLVSLAAWVLIKRWKTRRESAAEAANQPEMGQYHGRAPLLMRMGTGMGNGMSNGMDTRGHMDRSPNPSEPPFSPYADSSVSGHSSYSAGRSSEFHFPILSADGHLLPPAPASARMGISPEADRPLPLPPTSPSASAHGHAQDQGYAYPSTSPVIGLWPESLSAGGEHGYSRPASIAVTPMLSPGLEYGMVQPQKAVFHRSFSSEGQEYDLGVRH